MWTEAGAVASARARSLDCFSEESKGVSSNACPPLSCSIRDVAPWQPTSTTEYQSPLSAGALMCAGSIQKGETRSTASVQKRFIGGRADAQRSRDKRVRRKGIKEISG